MPVVSNTLKNVQASLLWKPGTSKEKTIETYWYTLL